MHSSIEVLNSLIKSGDTFVSLDKMMNSDKEFSEKLLWKLLKESIEEIKLFLVENQLNENLDIDFQQELLFELAINYTDYNVTDEFIEFLVATNHPEFIENVSFLKASKNQIIQLERANIKKHLNELDQLEEESKTGKIIELNSHLEERAMFEPDETAYKNVASFQLEQSVNRFNVSKFLKYAAIFIIVPTIITFIYLGSKSPEVVTASTSKNTTKSNKPISKTSTVENKDSIKSINKDIKELVIPTNLENTYEIESSNFEGCDSYGFVSKTMNIVVCNLSNQLQYLKNNKKESNQPKQIQRIQQKIDSIQGLNNSYEYDKTKSSLKLYTLLKLNNKDLQFFRENRIVRKNVLQVKNEYYEIVSTQKPTKLMKLVDEEVLELINR